MPTCKFFLQGSCAFGSACRFEHPVKDSGGSRAPASVKLPAPGRGGQRQQVCSFFLRGHCTFGDACRHAHVWPDEDAAWPDDDAAFDVPGPPWPEAMPAEVPHPFGQELSSWEPLGAAPGPPLASRRDAAALSTEPSSPSGGFQRYLEDAECGICFESVKRNDGKFGMLESCDHAFCLGCIRAWRQQKELQDRKNLRMCPLCRNQSFFVIPCERLLLDPAEKAEEIAVYKAHLGTIPCKAFDFGRGSCSFGTSCFYAHLNPDGTRHVPAPLRRMVGGDGWSKVVGEVKLCDFI